MSFHLYVGNYPIDFTRKDVADIFQEYDDIKILKFFKKEKKCYSFLLCKDIDQVVSVIREKNNALVSGRKLIVRASDAKLQEYVELLLSGTENSEPNSRDDEDKTLRVTEREDARSEEFSRSKSNVESPKFVPIQVLRNKASKYQNARDSHEQYDKYSCHSPSSSVSCQHNDDRYESGIASACSSPSLSSLDYQDDISELTWVSVTNFPLGISKKCLYELFSDYDPVDVQMICNEARKDKTITEALVCFLNRDIADDVILNFDNTMFHGRILLVNDTQDLTVMNELLNVLRL